MNGVVAFTLAVALSDAASVSADFRRAALDGAEQAASSVKEPHRRARMLAETALVRGLGGERERAAGTLAAAADAASAVEVRPLRDWAWHDIAVAYARVDDFAAALTIAGRIGDRHVRDAAYGEVATAQIRRLRFDAAADTAAGIARATSRSGVQLDIAMAQSDRGALEEALATARRITTARDNGRALAHIAAAFAAEGDFREARSLAVRIRDRGIRAEALAAIALERLRAGDAAAALALVESIDSERDQTRALARLARGHALLGDAAGAERLLDQAERAIGRAREPPEGRSAIWLEVADAALAAGNRERARAAVSRAADFAAAIPAPGMRDRILGSSARRLARIGATDEAVRAARQLSEDDSRVLLVRDIAVVRVEEGDPADALRLARGAPGPQAEATVLLGILGAQLRSAEPHEAVATIELATAAVRAIPDLPFAAGALAVLGHARERRGDLEAARRLLEEALEVAGTVPDAAGRARAYLRVAEALRD